ncbi:MAG: hypothetical protein B5M54_10990 [Candidatus Aminicenantes bacterium 4484_214]|nr:MAG: hypothetical protein B5M54_10990 [Candidatus Aminicenantes bacterium 4484_214]
MGRSKENIAFSHQVSTETMAEIAVIFNPGAAWGQARKIKPTLLAELKKHRITFDFFESQSEAHLLELARHVGSTYQYVLCAGGDTTFHLVLNEVMPVSRRPILGLLGVGSSNDIARQLGFLNLESLGSALQKKVSREVDVGAIFVFGELRRYFLGQVSLGLGVTVNRFVEKWLKRFPFLRGWSPFIGGWGILSSYFHRQVPFSLSLEENERIIQTTPVLVVISNTNYWASGQQINPLGQVDDGKLEAFVFRPKHLAQLAKLYQAMREGMESAFLIRNKKKLEKLKLKLFREQLKYLLVKKKWQIKVNDSSPIYQQG